MVIPRSFSSGALSIESKARNSAPPLSERVLVIAAVSVVLPWSMCPIVPTFTCGLVRSNFFFAIFFPRRGLRPLPPLRCALRSTLPIARGLSPPRGSNPRPRPYQGRALPTELGGRSLRSDIKKRLLSATPSRAWTRTIIRLRVCARQRTARNQGPPALPDPPSPVHYLLLIDLSCAPWAVRP